MLLYWKICLAFDIVIQYNQDSSIISVLGHMGWYSSLVNVLQRLFCAVYFTFTLYCTDYTMLILQKHLLCCSANLFGGSGIVFKMLNWSRKTKLLLHWWCHSITCPESKSAYYYFLHFLRILLNFDIQTNSIYLGQYFMRVVRMPLAKERKKLRKWHSLPQMCPFFQHYLKFFTFLIINKKLLLFLETWINYLCNKPDR